MLKNQNILLGGDCEIYFEPIIEQTLSHFIKLNQKWEQVKGES